MSFVTQDDVFEAIEPVLAGVFEEFANGKSVTPGRRIPAHPLSRGDAQIRLRQARSAQPDPDHRRVRPFRRLGLRPVRPDRRGRRRGPRHSGAGHRREEPQILRRHERLGARRRPCRPRLHHPEGRRARRPDRQESRRGSDAASWSRRSASAPTTASSSPPARRRRRPSWPARRAPASARSSA